LPPSSSIVSAAATGEVHASISPTSATLLATGPGKKRPLETAVAAKESKPGASFFKKRS
jgi:hypothetical protein